MAEFVAVITASAGVSEAQAAMVAERLGAVGAPRRLDPAAVEISVPAQGGADDTLRDAVGADVNVVPVAGRQKQILIADMDSTIIGVECIDELADFANVKAEVAEITEAAMQGALDFEGALLARVALLKGLPVAALQQCYDARVRLNPGAAGMVAGMSAAGAETALVSGGFTFFAERVAAAAGFASHRANTLLVADGRLTGDVGRPILGRAAKLESLDALCAARQVGPEAAVAIGDGANDLAMVRAAGLGVAWRAKPALRAEADAILDRSDLTAVLALQGLTCP